MKIKYREFNSKDYKEVECAGFHFQNEEYFPHIKRTVLVVKQRSDINIIKGVCEVFVEEL